MALQSLYTIHDLKYSDGKFSANISFDPKHEIFEGHFPGQPVVPGVVLIHILKDMCSKIVGRDIKLVKGTNIKFLNIIDPRDNSVVSVTGNYSEMENNMISLNANIHNEVGVNIKFKGVFSI